MLNIYVLFYGHLDTTINSYPHSRRSGNAFSCSLDVDLLAVGNQREQREVKEEFAHVCTHSWAYSNTHTHTCTDRQSMLLLLETATFIGGIERSVKRECICHATPTVLVTHISAKSVGQQKFCTDLKVIVWLSGKCCHLLSCWDQRIRAVQ